MMAAHSPVGVRLMLGLSLTFTLPLVAQQNDAPIGVRLRVAEDVQVGRQAPQIVLPYATQAGVGPAAQPFDLRKELGLVVVLAFYPAAFSPGCTAQWRVVRDRA